jgi:DNA repair protein RadC
MKWKKLLNEWTKKRRKMKNLYVKEEASYDMLKNPCDVWEKLSDIGKADQECMWVLGTNGDNKEIFRECVHVGGMEHVVTDPRIIFKRLLVNGCTAFFLAHNHISDTPEPSDDDIELTQYVQVIGAFLNIALTDHIIVTTNSMCSMREKNCFLDNDQVFNVLNALESN